MCEDECMRGDFFLFTKPCSGGAADVDGVLDFAASALVE